MPEARASQGGTLPAAKGLLARAVGVLTTPRSTYASIAAHPRVVGALALTAAVMVTGTLVFLNTEVGQQAVIDQQVQQAEAFGRPFNDEQYARLEQFAPYLGYIGAVFQVVGIVIGSLVIDESANSLAKWFASMAIGGLISVILSRCISHSLKLSSD